MAKNQKSYTPEFRQQIVDLHCKSCARYYYRGGNNLIKRIQGSSEEAFPRSTYYAALNHTPSKRERDLGSQYTSDEFEKYLQDHGMVHSFSKKQSSPYIG